MGDSPRSTKPNGEVGEGRFCCGSQIISSIRDGSVTHLIISRNSRESPNHNCTKETIRAQEMKAH